jgi:hypothetical protein
MTLQLIEIFMINFKPFNPRKNQSFIFHDLGFLGQIDSQIIADMLVDKI